jgi:GGDEF domain-containing protein
VSGSAGIALCPARISCPPTCLRAADAALCIAKQRGTAQVALLEPGNDRPNPTVSQRAA